MMLCTISSFEKPTGLFHLRQWLRFSTSQVSLFIAGVIRILSSPAIHPVEIRSNVWPTCWNTYQGTVAIKSPSRYWPFFARLSTTAHQNRKEIDDTRTAKSND
jgi:hypothetical protein